jgi:hypothetical protein
MLMKLSFHGSPYQPAPKMHHDKLQMNLLLRSSFVISLSVLIGTVILFWGLKDIYAEETKDIKTFKINVEVTNNGNLDEYGTIHVSIDGSRSPVITNNLIFPAFETSSYPFSFSSSEVPIGKGFIVEVVYGDDEIKRVYGTNTPSNGPEVASITIP